VRLVVDTGVLWRPLALKKLAESGLRVVVPAVVFAERARQVAKRGGTAAALREALGLLGFEVEALEPSMAARYAVTVLDDNDWRRLSRDALIAGHLQPDDRLWTTNPKDFAMIGVPLDQVIVVG